MLFVTFISSYINVWALNKYIFTQDLNVTVKPV